MSPPDDPAGPRPHARRCSPWWRRSSITSLVLSAAGDPVVEVGARSSPCPRERNVANIINNATVLYLSGLAVAIGFRMNLFNIGVDGQYRVAAFTAAVVAGEAWLPGLPQHRPGHPRARWRSVRCGPGSPASCARPAG